MKEKVNDPFVHEEDLYLPMPCPTKDCGYQWSVKFDYQPFIKSHRCPVCGFLMTVQAKEEGKRWQMAFVDKIRNLEVVKK